MLQFDVMQFRLEHEYGAPCRFERIPFRYPRWVTGPEAEIDRAASGRGRMRLYDAKGKPLILFEDEWNVRWALQHETKIQWHSVAP
jgi:peptide chain release factor 3